LILSNADFKKKSILFLGSVLCLPWRMPKLAITETVLRRRLGSNVRVRRKAALLTLKKAASRAKMHWRHWQKIEAGQTNATLFTLARMGEALNVEPGELLLEPLPRSPKPS
jgi:hypothetical protein